MLVDDEIAHLTLNEIFPDVLTAVDRGCLPPVLGKYLLDETGNPVRSASWRLAHKIDRSVNVAGAFDATSDAHPSSDRQRSLVRLRTAMQDPLADVVERIESNQMAAAAAALES